MPASTILRFAWWGMIRSTSDRSLPILSRTPLTAWGKASIANRHTALPSIWKYWSPSANPDDGIGVRTPPAGISITPEPLPSDIIQLPRIPLPSSTSERTAAPAPSPNRTHVPLSSQFSILLYTSAPTTRTLSYPGVPAYLEPMSRAWTHPAQTAFMSNAADLVQPSLCWAIPAVDESGTSGLLVARISMSMSSGERPASSIACWQASTARSLVQVSGSAILLSLIPVFVVIHSSLVSTSPAQSSLVITLGGTYDPRPTIPAGGIPTVPRIADFHSCCPSRASSRRSSPRRRIPGSTFRPLARRRCP